MAGRPSDYTKALAKEICDRLSEGELLKNICASENMPRRQTIWDWARTNKKENPEDETEQGFSDLYARAKENWCEAHADENLEIAADADENCKAGVLKAALQIKTREWLIERRSAAFQPKTINKHEHTVTLETLVSSACRSDK